MHRRRTHRREGTSNIAQTGLERQGAGNDGKGGRGGKGGKDVRDGKGGKGGKGE